MKKFKKGAASFYIIAFSTLILLIIAASFASIIISEVTRTSNDDLAQSAYDSALAGIEDAKLAFYNYRNCLSDGGNTEDCGRIMELMENGGCSMVGQILGRGEGDVVIEESNIGNNMQQAYTCVEIKKRLKDYRGSLSSAGQIKVVKVKFSSYEDGENKFSVPAEKIKSMKIKWYSSSNAEISGFYYNNFAGESVQFLPLSDGTQAPPVISVGLIQTGGDNFKFDDFYTTKDSRTNRGMVYLMPTDTDALAKNTVDGKGLYKGVYDGATNIISKNELLKSNDKTTTNLPYVVYCSDIESEAEEFACEVDIELPEPIGGNRNDDTFYIVVGLPYGRPTTDFSLSFYCGVDDVCMMLPPDKIENEDVNLNLNASGTGSTYDSTNQAYLDGVQIEVDSTGRANDMYRRVKARLENVDSGSMSIMGPLELLGDDDGGDGDLLKKAMSVICEWNFPKNC